MRYVVLILSTLCIIGCNHNKQAIDKATMFCGAAGIKNNKIKEVDFIILEYYVQCNDGRSLDFLVR